MSVSPEYTSECRRQLITETEGVDLTTSSFSCLYSEVISLFSSWACWYSGFHNILVFTILKRIWMILFLTLFMITPSCFPFFFKRRAYSFITGLLMIADLQAWTIAAFTFIWANLLTWGFVLMDVPDCLPNGAIPQKQANLRGSSNFLKFDVYIVAP